MSREDIRKLLGGYATGTLTPEEQEVLFAAALDDQELFDALAREQSLRDLLRDPAAKSQLLAALDPKPARSWVAWMRPAAAVMAMAGIAVVAVVMLRKAPPPQPVTVAVATPPPQVPSPRERDLEEAAPRVSKTARLTRRESLEFRKALRQEAAPPSQAAAGSRGVVGGAIGGVPRGLADSAAPAPKESPAPPPPPASMRANIPAPATESVSVSVSENAAADAANTANVPQARNLFLAGQIAASGPMASNYVETEPLQKKKQMPAPQDQNQGQIQARQSTDMKAVEALGEPNFPQPGVRYAVLRRSPEGRLDEVNLEDVKVGDTVSLRFEANSPGYLYAWARNDGGVWRQVASFTVAGMRPYTTPVLQPGDKEVYVWFSRQMQMAMPAPAPPAFGSQLSTNAVERTGAVTYVVNPARGAPAPQVRFTIRLP